MVQAQPNQAMTRFNFTPTPGSNEEVTGKPPKVKASKHVRQFEKQARQNFYQMLDAINVQTPGEGDQNRKPRKSMPWKKMLEQLMTHFAA